MAKKKKVTIPLNASQKSTMDLAGSGAKYATVEEMKRSSTVFGVMFSRRLLL